MYTYTGDGTTSVTSNTTATCTVAGAVVTYVTGGTCTLAAHATATRTSSPPPCGLAEKKRSAASVSSTAASRVIQPRSTPIG